MFFNSYIYEAQLLKESRLVSLHVQSFPAPVTFTWLLCAVWVLVPFSNHGGSLEWQESTTTTGYPHLEETL